MLRSAYAPLLRCGGGACGHATDRGGNPAKDLRRMSDSRSVFRLRNAQRELRSMGRLTDEGKKRSKNAARFAAKEKGNYGITDVRNSGRENRGDGR